MLACVAFEYVDASLYVKGYVKGCVEEEGDIPLCPSSTKAVIVRGEVVLRYCFIIITYAVWVF